MKTLRCMNIIKCLRSTWWDIYADTLIHFYKSFIRSVVNYGIFVYYPTQKLAINNLDQIEHLALRYALDYRYSTPTNFLLAEFLDRNYLCKIFANECLHVHRTIAHLQEICNKNRHKRHFPVRMLINSLDFIKDKADITFKNKHRIYTTKYNVIKQMLDIDLELGFKLKNCANPNHLQSQLVTK